MRVAIDPARRHHKPGRVVLLSVYIYIYNYI